MVRRGFGARRHIHNITNSGENVEQYQLHSKIFELWFEFDGRQVRANLLVLAARRLALDGHNSDSAAKLRDSTRGT